ncbi:MAG TPA: hypothetical protein PLA68_18485, partial [Panacibacter sp.]|nr:hypothetical protein [Panacibacter sp.]
MIKYKITGLLFSVFCITGCSVPENKDAAIQDTAVTNISTNNIVSGDGYTGSSQYGVWSGGDLAAADLAKYPFIKGWYIAYRWEKLEPQKDNFNWNYFDSL